MIQGLLIIVIFLSAAAYLVRIIYKQLQSKSACATGCGKCGTLDTNKIEKQIRASMFTEKEPR